MGTYRKAVFINIIKRDEIFSSLVHYTLHCKVECVIRYFLFGWYRNDVFAYAKVMLFALLIVMLLPMVASDVMFAHCAEGTTSQPKATSLGEADITCPQGQTSFG